MQEFLCFTPTLQLQNTTLAADDKSHKTLLNYASYQVDLDQLEPYFGPRCVSFVFQLINSSLAQI